MPIVCIEIEANRRQCKHDDIKISIFFSSPVLEELNLNPHSAPQSFANTSCTSSVNMDKGQGLNPLHPGTGFG